MPVRELLLLVVALVALVAAGGKSALLLAAGSSMVGWEPWRDQKWVGGLKDSVTLAWRGGGEGK